MAHFAKLNEYNVVTEIHVVDNQELIDSNCIGETISTLFQSWLLHTGPMRLQWLIDASKLLATDQLSVEDILLSTYKIGRAHV